MEMSERNGISLDRLVLGTMLVTVGVLAFAAGIDVWDPRQISKMWPLFLIAFGLAGEAEALRKRRDDGSSILLAVGVWMMAGINHWFGLSIATAMPLGLVVVGVSVLLHAFVDRPKRRSEVK